MEIIGTRIKASETVNCKKCGVVLRYNGYLRYDLEGNLREEYYYCSKCKGNR